MLIVFPTSARAPCKLPFVGVLPVNPGRLGDSHTEPLDYIYRAWLELAWVEEGFVRSHLVSADMKPIKAATALATASVIKFNLFKLRQWQKFAFLIVKCGRSVRM